MASIVLGSIVADIRGKVGSEVYSRNSAGLYVRAVPVWDQPDSDRQLACRAVITALSQAWSDTLTDDQRTDWRKYAHQFPTPNVWGNPVVTNGYLCFVRHNALYYRHFTSMGYADAPTLPPIHQAITTFVVHYDEGEVDVMLPARSTWTQPGYMTAYHFAGQPQNPGVSYYKAPFRYLGYNWATASVWMDNPATYVYPPTNQAPPAPQWDNATEGQLCWFRTIVQSSSYVALSTAHHAHVAAVE